MVERTWREFGDELHLFFRRFPLSHIPPHAQATETAEASGSQGRFWEMHGVLFNNQGHLEDEDLGHCTPQLCLDSKRFGRELAAARPRPPGVRGP